MRRFKIGLFLVLLFASILVVKESLAQRYYKPVTRRFTAVALLLGGKKFWLPGVFVVHKGDKVEFTLENKMAKSVHGFAIDEYKVREVVNSGEQKKVSFYARKEGVFRVYCHLHPAHIAAELVVLD